MGTNYLSSLSGVGEVWLANHLVPFDNEVTDLGHMYYRYRDIYCRHGNFGDVSAPLGITVEDIYSPSRYSSYIHYSSTGNMITLDGNVTVTGNFNGPSSNPFNQTLNTGDSVTFKDVTMTGSTTINGNITCHSALDVTHLRADGPYSIALYSNIIPATGNINLGSRANPFSELYVNFLSIKSFDEYGCERTLSGKEWTQQIQSEQAALEVLTHEVTKTLHHITYNNTKDKNGNLLHPDEIICTCGKSAPQPCPEHLTQWRDKYSRSATKRLEATSLLTLEHAAKFAKLETALMEANEKNSTLEQRLSLLEQKLQRYTEVNAT